MAVSNTKLNVFETVLFLRFEENNKVKRKKSQNEAKKNLIAKLLDFFFHYL